MSSPSLDLAVVEDQEEAVVRVAVGGRWISVQEAQLLVEEAEEVVEEGHRLRAAEAQAEVQAERWMPAEAVVSRLLQEVMAVARVAQKT